jgi:hypothetical protein
MCNAEVVSTAPSLQIFKSKTAELVYQLRLVTGEVEGRDIGLCRKLSGEFGNMICSGGVDLSGSG